MRVGVGVDGCVWVCEWANGYVNKGGVHMCRVRPKRTLQGWPGTCDATARGLYCVYCVYCLYRMHCLYCPPDGVVLLHRLHVGRALLHLSIQLLDAGIKLRGQRVPLPLAQLRLVLPLEGLVAQLRGGATCAGACAGRRQAETKVMHQP